MLVFLMAFREIPLSTMLYTDGTETVGVLLFLLKTESGGLEVTSAVSVVVRAERELPTRRRSPSISMTRSTSSIG